MAGALLAALRAKGVTAGGGARLRRGDARAGAPVRRCRPGCAAVDIVGTGGDASGSLNLSTGAALLAAACGVPVVKHGNRSVSSRSRAAPTCSRQLGPEAAARRAGGRRAASHATGFTFLFAPHFHPAMKAIAPVRRALGVRTVFNILGPLTNPAAPPFHLIGAFSADVARADGRRARGMPIQRAFVVHGDRAGTSRRRSGRSRCSTCGPGAVRRRRATPADFGLATCRPEALAGGDAAAQCARAARRAARRGPRARIATRCCWARRWRWSSPARSPGRAEGVARANRAIDDGSAARRARRARRVRRGQRGHERRLPRADGASRAARAASARAQLRSRTRSCATASRGCRRRRRCGCRREGFDLIAEVKLRSPAVGQLRAVASEDVPARVLDYAAAARPRCRC